MRRIVNFHLIFLLLIAAAAFPQSLGDVARQTRQKEKTNTHKAKKVVTNDDIPESPYADAAPPPANSGTMRTAPPRLMPSHSDSAEQWKQAILAQKNVIAELQQQIDRLSASIHFVEANAYYNGAQYNQHQARKQEQVEVMKKQLAEQQKKLESMQDAAKKAGMGSAVYDP